MFTGLVEEAGRVVAFAADGGQWRLVVAAPQTQTGVELGDSIAVNGCCLTLAGRQEENLWFDILEETRRCTNFSALRSGSAVNLERSLKFGGTIGGHFVTGHIDAVGTIEIFELRNADYYLRLRFPAEFARYLVPKGSIAIDGISLTVAELGEDSLAVWLIPHTLAVTNLREKKKGDLVNLEFDLLGKYAEKLLRPRLT